MPDPFISRDDLGDYIGTTLTTDAGALIAVDSACELVRTIAEQTFNAVAGDVLVLNGTGTDTLLLPETPVTAVSAVSVNGVALTSADYKFKANGDLYRVTSATDYSRPSRVWTWGRQNISVTYSHGYADADIPRDVRMVALALAARLFRQGTTGDVIQEDVGAYSVRYQRTVAAELTEVEEAILTGKRPIKVA